MWKVIKAYLLYTWGGLHRYFGNMNNLRGEHERAIHYFSRAYQTNPAFRQAKLARAIILWRELERPEEALRDLDALLAEDPKDGLARLNRAMVWQQTGRYELALEDLEAYLQLPRDDEYWTSAVRMKELVEALVDDKG